MSELGTPFVGKKRKGREGGVALPTWMDLDQETLPNAPTMGARAKRPAALDAFGGVGELTASAHAAAVVYLDLPEEAAS